MGGKGVGGKVPFGCSSSFTFVSEMGDTKPTGRGEWLRLDMLNVA